MSKFDFNEVVLIHSSRPGIHKLDGMEGLVAGKSFNEDGSMSYGVRVRGIEGVRQINEGELSKTGRTSRPSIYFSQN